MYSNNTSSSPYGQILYNYARLCPRHEPEVLCEEAQGPLNGEWRIQFFETDQIHILGTKEVSNEYFIIY